MADNAIDFREAFRLMLDHALPDERVDAMIIPLCKGELMCRKMMKHFGSRY